MLITILALQMLFLVCSTKILVCSTNILVPSANILVCSKKNFSAKFTFLGVVLTSLGAFWQEFCHLMVRFKIFEAQYKSLLHFSMGV